MLLRDISQLLYASGTLDFVETWVNCVAILGGVGWFDHRDEESPRPPLGCGGMFGKPPTRIRSESWERFYEVGGW